MQVQTIGCATIQPAPCAGFLVDWGTYSRVVPTYDKAVRVACRMGFRSNNDAPLGCSCVSYEECTHRPDRLK